LIKVRLRPTSAASLQAIRTGEQVCEMRQRSHAAAARVRTDPDPADPKWRSALSELTAALDWLGEHDQVYA
jgi:hypothetical protein